jgi:VWFA-related protein
LALLGTTVSGRQATPPAVAPAPSQGQQVRPDPQMPPITFKAEINYVEVDAVVRDDQGRFVRDLRRDEIQILENGKPQDLTTFFLVEIPVTRPERPLFTERAIEPDVRTNVGTLDGRVYVLFLDDVHTSVMRSSQVRRAARQFIERNFGANDVAAVVHASGRQDAGQEFTSNPRLLLAAIDKFMGKKLRSPTLERIDDYYRQRGMPGTIESLKDPLAFERAYNARALLESIGNISTLLAGVSGRRKALLMFSEGIDYDITDFMNQQDAMTIINETRDSVSAATRANVNIYTIDPRGLSTYADDAMEMQPPTDADPAFKLGMTGLMDENRIAQDSLRTLAEGTGGFASLTSNDFTPAFDRIVDENSTYYVLGYYPTNVKRDGSFRKIDVKTTRPGVTVRARRGYVAPRGKPPSAKGIEAKEGTSPALTEALNSPLQTGGLPIVVNATAFRGEAPNAAVALVTQTAPVQGLAFTQKDGKYTNKIEVSAIAVDPQGKVRGGMRDTVELSLRPETYARVQQAGFRIQSRLEVPPGRYQLRVAVREGGGKIGSVYYDLVVPDFAKEPLSMSGLVLSSALAGSVPTAGTIPEIKDILPGPPTAARAFSTRDQLAVLAEVYDNQRQASHRVEIVTSLRANDGRVAFSTSETRSSSELGGGTGGYGYTAVIPLGDLVPGLYVLRVEAKSTLEGQSAAREVLVRIAQ